MKAVLLTSLLGLLLLHCNPATSSAQMVPAADQIAGAVQAAPEDLRDGARVIGFDANGAYTDLRVGENELVCLADDPSRDGFNVACYHASIEPFMAMGRELRAQGMDNQTVRTRRYAAADSGELPMPETPAALYVLTGDSFDAATGTVENRFLRYVIYTPYATAESTGLATSPAGPLQPWLMYPGTAGAHVMITPARD
ncbi:MAG: hypothetical protein JJ896_11815 [Rhodothermales bacterium]|nr:hypothetical protein [Rhodothermales bacterium]MBO6780331.1 hypothetical protein [Rhodothermales bacterium]